MHVFLELYLLCKEIYISASLRDCIHSNFKMFFQERQKSNIQIINAIFIRTTN